MDGETEHATVRNTLRFSPRSNRAAEINWAEWGEEPFTRAAAEHKPVFLTISAVWCHWCHVMDETTYSDEGVIDLLNREYVPVRADTDMRPDINKRYNQGGWPSVAILTSEGLVLVGSTYLPPEDMRPLLEKVAGYCRGNSDRIAEEVRNSLAADEKARRTAPGEPGPEIRTWLLRKIKEMADREHGGLGSAPKFPQADTLALALDGWFDAGDRALRNYVEKSLHAFGDLGMYDQVEGGFFRYSVTRDFSVPHYEKMLEDNAKLLRIYLRAYGATGDSYYRDKAAHAAAYIAGTLSDGRRSFYGSQDADEEYYLLDAARRSSLAEPLIDRTLYTDMNAIAASAFLAAGAVLEREDYTALALGTLDDLWTCHESGRGLCHYRTEDGPQLWGLLDDQSFTVEALLEAFEATGDDTYISRAVILADEMIAHHLSDEDGFFDLADFVSDMPGNLRFRAAELPGNAQAARALILLGEITGRADYGEKAERALRLFAGIYREHGLFAADYARSVELMLHGPTEVLVVGEREDALTRTLAQAAWKSGAPNLLVNWIDPSRPAAEAHNMLGISEMPKYPTARICKGRTCLKTVDSPTGLSATLKSLFEGVKEDQHASGIS